MSRNTVLPKVGGVTIRVISSICFVFWLWLLWALVAMQSKPIQYVELSMEQDFRVFAVIALFIIAILIMLLDTVLGNYFLKKRFKKNLMEK